MQLLHSWGVLFIPSGIINHNSKTMFLVEIGMVDLKTRINYNKMKIKIWHTVRIITTSNINIVERVKIDSLHTQIHDRSLFCPWPIPFLSCHYTHKYMTVHFPVPPLHTQIHHRSLFCPATTHINTSPFTFLSHHFTYRYMTVHFPVPPLHTQIHDRSLFCPTTTHINTWPFTFLSRHFTHKYITVHFSVPPLHT